MLVQTFFLFILGLLILLGSFWRGLSHFWKMTLRWLGSLLMCLPLALLIYLLWIIFGHSY